MEIGKDTNQELRQRDREERKILGTRAYKVLSKPMGQKSVQYLKFVILRYSRTEHRCSPCPNGNWNCALGSTLHVCRQTSSSRKASYGLQKLSLVPYRYPQVRRPRPHLVPSPPEICLPPLPRAPQISGPHATLGLIIYPSHPTDLDVAGHVGLDV